MKTKPPGFAWAVFSVKPIVKSVKMEIKEFLTDQGYAFLREVPGRGWCGIRRMLFTWGLFHGMTAYGIGGRYCYDSLADARNALIIWDGAADPPGRWVKHFGDGGEYCNMLREIEDRSVVGMMVQRKQITDYSRGRRGYIVEISDGAALVDWFEIQHGFPANFQNWSPIGELTLLSQYLR